MDWTGLAVLFEFMLRSYSVGVKETAFSTDTKIN